MAESKRRPAKLKGAVLVMVVTLLFVLVVMLLATLTVVSNANRRTITKYEENQAYYTARSALEVYIDEMLEDEAKVTGLGTKVQNAWTAAGFAFDSPDADAFTTNLTANKDFDGKDMTNGFVHQQEIFGYLEPKYKLKTDGSGALLKDGAQLDPKDSSNWEERVNSGSDKYDYNNSYIEYTATLPATNVQTGASTDASKTNIGIMADDNTVKIKVELLRAVYIAKDGNVLTDGVYKIADDGLGTYYTTGTDAKLKISQIDWNSTYYRLKVTATTSISDNTGAENEATVSVLLEPTPVISPKGFNNAMTSLQYTSNPDKIHTIGGASASFGSGNYYDVGNNSSFTGSYVYQTKGLRFSADTSIRNTPSSYFVVHDGYLLTNNPLTFTGYGSLTETDPEKLAQRPFVYAEGARLYKTKVGTSTASACDIIAVNKDGHLKADGLVPSVTGADATKAAMVINEADNVFYGDVYCDGDIYINANSCTFYGNVYCTGNIYVTNGNVSNIFAAGSSANIGGKIFDGAGVMLGEDGCSFDAAKLGTGSVVTGNATTAGYAGTWTLNTANLNDDLMMEINLPGRGDVKITPVDNIKDPYVYSQKDIDDGAAPAGKSAGNPISASEMFNNNICGSYKETKASLTVNSSAPSILNCAETGSLQYKDPVTNTTKSVTGVNVIDPSKGFMNPDTGLFEMKLDFSTLMNNNNTYYIDATSSSLQIQLKGSNDNSEPTFIVVGDKSVVFTVAANEPNAVSVKCLSVLTAQINDMFAANTTFDLGDNPANPNKPKAPNIYFYIGENTTLQFRNSDNTKISAYLYGPEAYFDANTWNNAKTINYTYDSVPVGSTYSQKVSFLGSMVFKDINTQTSFGVAYISPSSDSGAATGTRIQWDRQRYLGS